MHVNALFDLLENRFADVVIQPRKSMREVEAACSLVDANDTPGTCLSPAARGLSAASGKNCYLSRTLLDR